MANLGLQNNNPGNLKDPNTGAFRRFDTPAEGHQALLDDLAIKQSGKSSVIKPGASLRDFASVWSPTSDNQKPGLMTAEEYADNLAKHTGTTVDTPFDKIPRDQLASAIMANEGTSTMPTTGASTQKLSVDAFAEKIKAKYPQYKDIDNQTLTQKILAKYPQYQDHVETTPAPSIPEGPKPNPSFTDTNEDGTPRVKLTPDGTNAGMGDTASTYNGSILNDFGHIGQGLVSGTIEAGKDIAAAIGGNTMIDKFNALPKADQDYISTLILLRNKAAQKGDKDTVAHYQNLIKGYKASDGETITQVFPALNKSTEQVLGDFASMGLELVGTADAAGGIKDLVTGGAKAAAEAGAEGATKTFGEKALEGAKTGAKFGAGFGVAGAMQDNQDLGDVAEAGVVGAATGAALGAGTAAIGEGLGKLRKGGMSAEEILKVKPEDVSKLSQREQKLWYSEASRTARQQAQEAADLARQAGEQSTKQAVEEIKSFNSQIGNTSREEAIKLKEPAKQLMREASDEYLSLTGEAAEGSPALSKTTGKGNLSSEIDSKFEHDPELASSLKEDLGLNNRSLKVGDKVTVNTSDGSILKEDAKVVDIKTHEDGNRYVKVEGSDAYTPIENISSSAETITNQEVLNKARAIMQDVSKTAKNGTKVYSAEEYEAMKKYSFLMEYLNKNGVDMTAANKFWKEWVPVRDRIFREIKPFDEGNVKDMPITRTMQKASATPKTPAQASSKLDAQNFIKEIERRMKLPEGSIGQETRDLVQKLEQAKIDKDSIKEVVTEATKQIKADKEKALQKMKLSQYNDESVARRRAIIKKVIVSVLGLGALSKTNVGKAVMHATGL